MLGHVAIAWGIFVGCLGFAFRVGFILMSVAALMESKPQRKRGNRYPSRPLSLELRAIQAASPWVERAPRRRRRKAQGLLFS